MNSIEAYDTLEDTLNSLQAISDLLLSCDGNELADATLPSTGALMFKLTQDAKAALGALGQGA